MEMSEILVTLSKFFSKIVQFLSDNLSDIGVIFTTIGAIFTAIGVIFTYYQIKKANIQKKIEYMMSIYNDFLKDKNMREIYYKIEYSTFVYDENFHTSEDEKNLDKLIEHFANIWRLYSRGILNKNDLDFIKYRLLVIYQNPEIKKYFSFLDKWYLDRKLVNENIVEFKKIGKILEENDLSAKK